MHSTLSGTEGNLDVTFSPGGVSPMNNIPPGGTQVRSNVPAGSYTATAFWLSEATCSVPFVLNVGENQVLNLPGDCD